MKTTADGESPPMLASKQAPEVNGEAAAGLQAISAALAITIWNLALRGAFLQVG
jgi:hypothetical protein